MKISEYIAQFDEQEVINTFAEIVKHESPDGYFFNEQNVEIIDVENFLETYCVAFGEDGIADFIVREFNRRANRYFGLVSGVQAKEMALGTLRSYFLHNGNTMFKADSPFASALDWFEESYRLLDIPLNGGEQRMILVLDMKKFKFDAEVYINGDWGGNMESIMEIVRSKIEYYLKFYKL